MEKLTRVQAEKEFERRYKYPSSELADIGLRLVECHCNGAHCPGWIYDTIPGFTTKKFNQGVQAQKAEAANV